MHSTVRSMQWLLGQHVPIYLQRHRILVDLFCGQLHALLPRLPLPHLGRRRGSLLLRQHSVRPAEPAAVDDWLMSVLRIDEVRLTRSLWFAGSVVAVGAAAALGSREIGGSREEVAYALGIAAALMIGGAKTGTA